MSKALREAARAAGLALALAAPAAAVDGRLEIHQACVAGGCLPGDAPGFPVTIAAGGSYVLTSNLTVPDADTDAVEVTAGDVVVDLNGFTIAGPTRCSKEQDSCVPEGTGSGVRVSPLAGGTVVVRNGIIRGMGSSGVYTSNSSGGLIEGLTIEHAAFAAISTAGAVVRGNVIRDSYIGVQCSQCLVVQNMVSRCLSHGVNASVGTLVRDNVLFINDGLGISGLDTAVGYGGNLLTANNGGGANPQVSGAVEIGVNQCGGDTVCP